MKNNLMTRKQADTGRACWAIAKRLKREGNNIKIDLFGPPSRALVNKTLTMLVMASLMTDMAMHYGSTTYLYFLDDVTQRANDVPYGLCASVWSENAGRIHRVASKLKVSH